MNDKIIKILALTIGFYGIIVMIGWIFDIDSLTRIIPLGINMSFPTALMFFLSAIDIYFIYQTIKKDSELFHLIISGIALIIFLINITILMGVFLNIQTGMENLFIQSQQYESINTTIARAPSISTMICFILLGLINLLALFSNSKNLKKIKFLGYCIFIISLVAIIGYVIKIPFLYYKFSDSTIPMALNTAMALTLLSYVLITISKLEIKNET